MQNELDAKLVLRVFEKIRQNGKKETDLYFLDGVEAKSDFDGYTLYLSDATVNLSFGFHNQYHYEYQTSEQLAQFEKKLNYIDQNY